MFIKHQKKEKDEDLVVSTEDISEHEARFQAFIEPFIAACSHRTCMPLELKRKHTFNVLEHVRRIQKETDERLLKQAYIRRAALLAALYHDLGRFPQFLRWQTFSDTKSVNHGFLASKMLKRSTLLVSEDETVRRLVRAAVCMHNTHSLPKGLPDDILIVTQLVRDADKIDIFRIMAHQLNAPIPSKEVVLHVQNDPQRWSKHIVRCIMSGAVPNYKELETVNDFRLLLASWLGDFHFVSARRFLAQSGMVQTVLHGLPDDPLLNPVLKYLHNLIEQS